ncbi:hypothetical protein SD70_31885 [Gordoniibacillus kamchatkensis]|uniref:Uncharacterized protein n=1 Tax=Gordoniibacillus kamchatkensis TaxID=1590651 RepID=A0ABR5A4Y5_9BACL|nr:hypothetical protein [Paenibacillus sp. VKM B-2647]KIL36088.1 hypothetical protein SD70_31885 [Paenibacillus sp. VKM B-2647]
MDEEHRKDKTSAREITYQVGWSRGRIHPQDGGKQGKPSGPLMGPLPANISSPVAAGRPEKPVEPKAADPGEREERPSARKEMLVSARKEAPSSAVRGTTFTYSGLHRESFAERIVWRPLPAVPARWTTALLWAAPVAGFALTYALVLALTRAP